MRFMVMVKANAETEAGVPPDAKGLLEMNRFNQELIARERQLLLVRAERLTHNRSI